MTSRNITFRTTTPTFLGGADPTSTAEFRLASFKGVLRFWWRATQWGNYTDPTDLKEEEDAIFGSSDQNVGQSKVRLRLINNGAAKPLTSQHVLWNGTAGGAYYLGYGCVNAFHIKADPSKNRPEKKAGELLRPCLEPFNFRIQVLFPRITEQRIESVNQAVWLMTHLGGLGAKSRKGYGSLSIVDWNGFKPAWIKGSPDETFKHLMQTWSTRSSWSDEPEWTAFNAHTRIVKVELKGNSTDVRDLLDRIGREMVRFRSWGKNGEILGKIPREGRFQEDHDLFKGLPTKIKHPKRIAFGMPHNYDKPPNKHVYPDTASPNSRDEGRRGSPLFIHIHQPDAKVKPVAYLAFFPTLFLPTGINIKSFGNTTPITMTGLYDPIHQFLDRLEEKTPPSDPENVLKEQLKGTKVL